MKMPKGFNRFKEWAYNFDSMRRFEGDIPNTLSNAANLMQEMAESLEDCLQSQIDKVDWIKANKILKKFQEWK
jgi:hypothetical protein